MVGDLSRNLVFCTNIGTNPTEAANFCSLYYSSSGEVNLSYICLASHRTDTYSGSYDAEYVEIIDDNVLKGVSNSIMAMKLSTTLVINDFCNYIQSIGTSENYLNQNLKASLVMRGF